MKKEKPKDRAEAQAIEVYYRPGEMVFRIGDREFFLTEETAGRMFGRPVQIQFEQLSGQDDTFGGLRTLPLYVRIQRLLAKGLGWPEIARVLNVGQEQARRFYAVERGRPRVESWNVNELENERKRQADLEMDFCKEARRDRALNETEAPEAGERFIDLLEIRNLRRQGKSDERIADELHLDKKEFSKFMDLNRRYLDLLQ